MPWHKYIFSDHAPIRTQRHLLLWIAWWVYIVFLLFFTKSLESPGQGSGFRQHQPGLDQLGILQYSLLVISKSFLLLLLHVIFCYTIIQILFRKKFPKKNILLKAANILLVCLLMVAAGYFLYALIFPLIDAVFNLQTAKAKSTVVWTSIDASLVNGTKITLIASAIIQLKIWWLKQQEKIKLEKEKVNAELQLLKAQVHPAFLFSTLNNIINHAKQASPKAPEMLIKLSDMLSYMLYECDEPKVKLEKEIGMIKDYIALEKLSRGDKLEMTFQCSGNINGQLISPLILLPFIDNSFTHCNAKSLEQAWVNIEILVDNDTLSLKLINGMPSMIGGDNETDENLLSNIKKRLGFLYPGRHELKINAEQELLMVHLNLNLEEVSQDYSPVMNSA